MTKLIFNFSPAFYGAKTKLGLDSGDYYLHLSETIFKLVGITVDDEDFFEEYMEECKTVLNIDIFKHPELLNSLAHTLYHKLIEESELLQKRT